MARSGPQNGQVLSSDSNACLPPMRNRDRPEKQIMMMYSTSRL